MTSDLFNEAVARFPENPEHISQEQVVCLLDGVMMAVWSVLGTDDDDEIKLSDRLTLRISKERGQIVTIESHWDYEIRRNMQAIWNGEAASHIYFAEYVRGNSSHDGEVYAFDQREAGYCSLLDRWEMRKTRITNELLTKIELFLGSVAMVISEGDYNLKKRSPVERKAPLVIPDFFADRQIEDPNYFINFFVEMLETIRLYEENNGGMIDVSSRDNNTRLLINEKDEVTLHDGTRMAKIRLACPSVLYPDLLRAASGDLRSCWFEYEEFSQWAITGYLFGLLSPWKCFYRWEDAMFSLYRVISIPNEVIQKIGEDIGLIRRLFLSRNEGEQ